MNSKADKAVIGLSCEQLVDFMMKSSAEEWNLFRASFDGPIAISGVNIANVNLSGKNLFDISFSGSTFKKITFEGATLTRSKFTACSFIECEFESVNAIETTWETVSFERTQFKNCDFSSAKFLEVHFYGKVAFDSCRLAALFQNMNFNSITSVVSLFGSNLYGARFDGVKISANQLLDTCRWQDVAVLDPLVVRQAIDWIERSVGVKHSPG